MDTLVAGGAGFIGSHLAEALLEGGERVTILDDLSTGSIANVEHLKDRPGFRYRIDSVFNAPLVAELVDGADFVVHLAAAVGVRLIVESPVRTIETNIRGTEIVLNNAAKKKKPVLLASTSEVYGKATKVPFSEDDDCVLGPTVRGRWSYACSKLVDEFLALSYWKERQLPTIVVRLFNTVGPRQTGRYGMVVPRFVAQAIEGGPITVYGDGKQSRCFSYVGDVVGAIVRLTRETRAYGQVFNIGSDEEITIEELARLTQGAVNPSARIEYVPYEKAYEAGFEDMRRRVPDLRKIRALIDYRPTIGIRRIIERVAEDQKARAG